MNSLERIRNARIALLLDEPFSSLDAETRHAVGEAVHQAQRTWRIPFVLVTHDRAEAERLGDRIVLLRAGRQADGDG